MLMELLGAFLLPLSIGDCKISCAHDRQDFLSLLKDVIIAFVSNMSINKYKVPYLNCHGFFGPVLYNDGQPFLKINSNMCFETQC